MKEKLRENRFLLQVYIEKLNGLSPLGKLNQGFSFVSDENGKAVTSVKQVKTDDELTIHVTDGQIRAIIRETKGITRI